MKRRPSLSFVLFFLFVIFSPSESSAEHKTSPGGGDGILPKDPSISLPGLNGSGRVDYVDGDVIVKFRKRMWQEDIVHAKDIFPDLGTSAIHLLSKQCGQRHALIRSNALSTEEILVALEDHPLVESVSPNFRRRIAGRDIKRTTLGIADGGSLDADDTTGAKMIASIPHLPWTQFRPVIIAVVDTGID
ncbi:MAG: hypothetical protein SV375_18770, partial [Thermodesulfobacteriota bacterium]|nr:hypothetical protein [Thermodesulfobacteriota bacterium]